MAGSIFRKFARKDVAHWGRSARAEMQSNAAKIKETGKPVARVLPRVPQSIHPARRKV